MARLLGDMEEITSPTFVIQKIYPLTTTSLQPFKKLVHIDAYRLEKGDELSMLNWKEIITDPGNLILIEWPVHVAEVMPFHIKLRFRFIDETTREIVLEK